MAPARQSMQIWTEIGMAIGNKVMYKSVKRMATDMFFFLFFFKCICGKWKPLLGRRWWDALVLHTLFLPEDIVVIIKNMNLLDGEGANHAWI